MISQEVGWNSYGWVFGRKENLLADKIKDNKIESVFEWKDYT